MDYDSDSDTDMASGSTRTRYRGLKGDKVPRWDAQKTTYDAWWYEMVPYLKTQGLPRTQSSMGGCQAPR